jgi:hypothetical protein
MIISMSESKRVEVTVTESFGAIVSGQPSMRHRRYFSNTSPEQLLSLLMGLKFCGKGGLMVDSTADSEECSSDGNSRFIRNFKPLGASFASIFAGAFNVRQEILECSLGSKGVVAAIRMSFSPCRPEEELPCGSFLWEVEPQRPGTRGTGACWTESINTRESLTKQIPELRIATGKKRVFLLGHNRLNEKAAARIVEILNQSDDGGVVFADYAGADRLNFRPGKCGP